MPDLSTNKEKISSLIKEHNFDLKQIYDYFNIDLTKEDQTCLICNKNFKLNKKQLKDFNNGQVRIIGCCPSCRTSFLLLIKGNPFSKEDVKKKIKQTNLEKYGVEYPAQSKIIYKKVKQTCLDKYGVENGGASEIAKEKRKLTNLEKYGTENVFASEEIKEKIKQINLEKYGVEYIGASKEIRDKIKKTMLDRYNVYCALQLDDIKEKTKQTNLERYGVAYPTQNSEIYKKIKQTNLERYGVENPNQCKEIREKTKQTNLKKYGTENVYAAKEIRDKIIYNNIKKYGIKYACQLPQCIEASKCRVSKINKKIYNKLIKEGLNPELEYIIENRGYDIKINNILIEINPTYTHNSTYKAWFNNFQKDLVPFDYHYNKTKLANDNGFICIHIFDWMNINEIIEDIKLGKYTNQKIDINSIKKHWYNPKTKQHVVDNGMQSEIIMIQQGYIEIYDDGSIII